MTENRRIVWLTGFSHFITHGFMTILPAVLVAITSEQSIRFMDLGLIAGVGYFLYGLGAFPAGYLADRFGSKRMMTVGALGMAVSSILISLTSSLAAFAVTYGLLGIFASIHHPAGLSLIARRIAENKGRAMGLHGVLGNVGLFFSPLLAALAVMLFGTWRAAYLLFGLVGLAFFFLLAAVRIAGEKDLSFRVRPGRPEPLRPARQPAAGPGPTAEPPPPGPLVIPLALLFLLLGSILSGFIFRGSLTFLPTLLQQDVALIANHDQPLVMAGYLTTAVLSLGLLGAWFGGYINDKVKHPELVPALIFLVAAPLLYYAGRFTNLKLVAVMGFFSLIYYAWQPSQNYLIAKYTRKASHGMGFGINFFLIFGMGSVATSVGGYVADDFGVSRFYLLMAGIGSAAFLTALAVYWVRAYSLRFPWKLAKEAAPGQRSAPAAALEPRTTASRSN